jgi:hypothetical protein
LDRRNWLHTTLKHWRVGGILCFVRPVPAAKFINKSSLYILFPGVIRRLKLNPNSEQKVEHIFVARTYCQTAC